MESDFLGEMYFGEHMESDFLGEMYVGLFLCIHGW